MSRSQILYPVYPWVVCSFYGTLLRKNVAGTGTTKKGLFGHLNKRRRGFSKKHKNTHENMCVISVTLIWRINIDTAD